MHLHARELPWPGVGEVERIRGDEVQGLVVALEADRCIEAAEPERPLVRGVWRPAYEQIVYFGGRRAVFERRRELREYVRVPHRLEQADAQLAGRKRVAAGHAIVVGSAHG